MTIKATIDQVGVSEYTVFGIVKWLSNIACSDFL